MKIFFDMLSHGSLLRGSMADFQVQLYDQLRVGFELTVDRVMFICMQEQWPVIPRMSGKLAGGVKNKDVNGDEFLKQYGQVDTKILERVVMIQQRKNPHPPILH